MESLISILAGLVVGAVGGYTLFRYVLKKTYNRILDEANRESEVIKEKKLLEVKEKFLNKKAELEKEVGQRNQRIQQAENKLKQREISLTMNSHDASPNSTARRAACKIASRRSTNDRANLKNSNYKSAQNSKNSAASLPKKPRRASWNPSRMKHAPTPSHISTKSWTMPK